MPWVFAVAACGSPGGEATSSPAAEPGFDGSALFNSDADLKTTTAEWIFKTQSNPARIASAIAGGPALVLNSHGAFMSDSNAGIEYSFLFFDGGGQFAQAEPSDADDANLSCSKGNSQIQLFGRFRSMGPIVGKMAHADQEYGKGWLLEVARDGRIKITLNSATPVPFQVLSSTPVENNRWHRLSVIINHDEKQASIVMDGIDRTGEIRGTFPNESIANEGEFTVGRFKNNFLKADLAYLRVASENT